MPEILAHNSEGMKPRDSMSFPEISRQVLEEIGEIVKSGKNNALRILLLVTLAAAGAGCEKKEAPQEGGREGRVFESEEDPTKIAPAATISHTAKAEIKEKVNPAASAKFDPLDPTAPGRMIPGSGWPYYVNRNGKNEFGDTHFMSAEVFSEGFAVVQDSSNSNPYYINRNGANAFGREKFSEGKKFYTASPFKDGLALVGDNPRKFYYINKYGDNAFGDKEFDFAGQFSEGFSAVQINERWFYINKKGENAFGDKQFDKAESFSEGLALVKENDKWRYIKRNGENAFGDKQFDQAESFSQGFANVVEGRRPYVIDKNGNPSNRSK